MSAKTNYTALIEQLKTISNEPSDSGNRRGYREAYEFIQKSELDSGEKQIVVKALHSAADTNQGYYYNSNGVHGALKAISELEPANDDSFDPEPPKTLTVGQLIKQVESGRIFGVSFIKRATGELRTMACRLGVKKFLRGGQMAYSPSEKRLLTVFSMADKGYRCIPLDGVKSVCVGGQTYSLEVA